MADAAERPLLSHQLCGPMQQRRASNSAECAARLCDAVTSPSVDAGKRCMSGRGGLAGGAAEALATGATVLITATALIGT